MFINDVPYHTWHVQIHPAEKCCIVGCIEAKLHWTRATAHFPNPSLPLPVLSYFFDKGSGEVGLFVWGRICPKPFCFFLSFSFFFLFFQKYYHGRYLR